jgi:hypothetical protein
VPDVVLPEHDGAATVCDAVLSQSTHAEQWHARASATVYSCIRCGRGCFAKPRHGRLLPRLKSLFAFTFAFSIDAVVLSSGQEASRTICVATWPGVVEQRDVLRPWVAAWFRGVVAMEALVAIIGG